MRKLTVFFFLPLLVAGSLMACGKSGLKDKTQVLERSVRSVCNYIRWGQWDRLQSFMRKSETDLELLLDKPKPKPQPLGSIRVIECENLAINAENSLDHAQVVSDIKFHTENTISIRKLRYVQEWWQHKETGRWYLSSDMPDFCGAMGARAKGC